MNLGKTKLISIAAVILATLIALLFYFFIPEKDNGEIPYIRAAKGPNKVKPDPDSDITSSKYNPIYDQIKSQKYNTSVSMSPSPEKPLTIESNGEDNITQIVSKASKDNIDTSKQDIIGKKLVVISEQTSEEDERKIRKSNRYIYAQIASTRSKQDAEREFLRISKKHQKLLKHYDHKVEKFDIKDKGRYYKLLIGPIPSASKAQLVCKKLIASGVGCIIKRI